MKVSIDDIRDRIVFTEKVAHVTFYLVKNKNEHPEWVEDEYVPYTESEKRGLEVLDNFGDLGVTGHCPSYLYDDAMVLLREAMQELERIIEEKRNGNPTPKQLHFLFRQKISIPLTLTWGEASDLISERLHQIEKEKQERKRSALLAKFGGFAVGDRVSHTIICDNTVKMGVITKLHTGGGIKIADIKHDDGGTTSTRLKNLERIDIPDPARYHDGIE